MDMCRFIVRTCGFGNMKSIALTIAGYVMRYSNAVMPSVG